MPCQLSEEVNYVKDDVSYMCNLAMEKCSRKMEKKKASCGGAAMRKRLLIKNFVAQMLAQEKQTREQSLSTENVDGSTLKYISTAQKESSTGGMEIDEDEEQHSETGDEEESELNKSMDEDDIEDEEEEGHDSNENREYQEAETAATTILSANIKDISGCIADNNNNERNRGMTFKFGTSQDFQKKLKLPTQFILSQNDSGLTDEDDWDDENEKPFQNQLIKLGNVNQQLADTDDTHTYGNRKRTLSLILEDHMMDIQPEMTAPSHLLHSSTETFTMLSPLCCGLLQLQPFDGQTAEMQIGFATRGEAVPYSQPLMKRVKL